jgi:hypothetical protein
VKALAEDMEMDHSTISAFVSGNAQAVIRKKRAKLEKLLMKLIEQQKENDKSETPGKLNETCRGYVKSRKGGHPIQSNITDNESAKIKGPHGVIQGYNGIAVADCKNQVIVAVEAVVREAN